MTLNSDELRAYQQAAAYHNDPSGRLLQLIYTHVIDGEDAVLEQMTEYERALYELHLAKAKALTGDAHDACLTGRPVQALDLLDEALAAAPDSVARADVQHLRGRILVLQAHPDAAFSLLVDEAQRVRDVDPARAASMLAEAALDCISSADIPKAVTAARQAYEVSQHAGPAERTVAMSDLATALVLAGQRAEAGPLLERCLPLLRVADPLTGASEVLANAAHSFAWIERYEIAFQLIDRLITSARTASAPTRLPFPLAVRAELNLRLGRWALATAEAEEALELAEGLGQSPNTSFALGFQAWLAATAGDEPRCRDLAARILDLVEEHGIEPGRSYGGSTLGLLELGLGRMDEAIRHLESVRDHTRQVGVAEPNIIRSQADLIEAYVHSGELDAARDALCVFERQARRTGGHWALGAAARCGGLLASDKEADACFATALEQLVALPDPFEIARTHLCRGERLRRAGQRTAGRRALRQAIDEFDRLGAHPWTARARAELRATGANPRRRQSRADRDQLTAHELQVALIVANGASNREAAAALFLSPKTIEFHLTHIYRKLGVRTRTQLAALAAKRGWLAGPSAAANQD